MRQTTRITLLTTLLVVGIIGVLGLNFYQYQKSSQDQAFGDQVRAYLLENPKIIREVIEKLQVVESQEKQQLEQQALSMFKSELENDGFSYVAGNPDGDVTIVEFFDYRCGYCKKSFPDVMKVVEADGNIRLVLKEFPILGPPSVMAAQAAVAAQNQGKYMAFHVALMEMRGSVSEAKLIQIATDVGLDVDKMLADMSSDDVKNKISRTYSLAKQLDITGTPAFVIGGRLASGAIPPEQMMALVKDARAAKDTQATN